MLWANQISLREEVDSAVVAVEEEVLEEDEVVAGEEVVE